MKLLVKWLWILTYALILAMLVSVMPKALLRPFSDYFILRYRYMLTFQYCCHFCCYKWFNKVFSTFLPTSLPYFASLAEL